MNKRRIIPSLVLNLIIFTLMIIGLILLFTLEAKGAEAFKYFTTDCAILMGIASFIYSIYLIRILKKKTNYIPKTVELFKMVMTVGSTITMLVVCLIFSFMVDNATFMFANSNALYHVAIPILSITTWLVFEHSSNKILFPECLYGFVPIIIYGIFYLAVTYTHISWTGKPMAGYDWYGMLTYGKQYAALACILMLVMTFVVSWALWLGNKKFNIQYETMKRWQYKRFWSMFCNGLIFIMFFITMIVRFVHDAPQWDEPAWYNFKFFTTQSNIMIGVYALIFMIFEAIQFNRKEMSEPLNVIKMLFTTYIIMTMIVTVFGLAPGAAIFEIPGWPPKRLFVQANIMLHVFIPLVSGAAWLLFEHTDKIKFNRIWFTYIYFGMYGIFYLIVAYTHRLADGTIPMTYDWYWFCKFGYGGTVGIYIGLLAAAFLATWLVWLLNRKINIYKDIPQKKVAKLNTKKNKRTSPRG